MSGLEVIRPNGTVRFNLSSRPFNFLGLVADTGVNNGSVTITGLTAGGRPNFFPMPLQDFNDRIPDIYISGGVLYWTFKNPGNTNNCRHRILYGEW